jgi:DNA-binding PadR family transcriptional regulator
VQAPEPSLTPTSYLVLGLVRSFPGATSYDLKAIVARSIGYFWPFPHSQLYAEPARLAGLGLLDEDREQGGRKRRRYSVTDAGGAALDQWLSMPEEGTTEIRDLGLLQLFFSGAAGPDRVRALAAVQIGAHESRLSEYTEIADHAAANESSGDTHMLATLAMGLRFERAALTFWRDVEAGADELAQGRLAAMGFPA